MAVLANRVKMSTSTIGTGTIDLDAAETGYQSFADGGITNGQVVSYAIEDGAAWEIGTGTYTTGTPDTLSRTVIESSNSDAEISLTGNAVVFITALSGDLQNAVDMDQGVATTDSPSFAGLSVNSNPIATDGSLSNRNRVINGALVIDQRNAGAAVTVNNAAEFYAVDRFAALGQSADGVFTLQQSTTAPEGFVNSIVATVTTADASIGSTQLYNIQHKIEGTNVADLGWGTANAKTVTLSFWVRSSLTGTFGGALSNSAFNRSYPFTYTISSADTWEQKSVTIAGDISGTWLTTTGIGLRIYFSIGAGSSRVGTADTWAGAGYIAATGATNIIATNGATFYITGVQLEVGDTATPFEHRSYGQELALCQRYYQTGTARLRATLLSGVIEASNQLPVTMRATPTMTGTGMSSLTANTILVSDTSTGSTGNVAYTASAEL